MSLYKIAEFIIEIKNKYSHLENQCIEYEYKGEKSPDFIIEVNVEEIDIERKVSDYELTYGCLESVCAYRNLSSMLPLYDAFLLHGSVIDVDGHGVAFLAKSGVGKTTHTLNWLKSYEDRVTIINGDKPIIRFFDDVPYAYGTPWAGKEHLQTNSCVKLTDICFIERCEDNIVLPFEKSECICSLMQQVLHPAQPEAALKTLELLDKLLKSCKVWKIKCNMNSESAQIAYERIIEGR